MVTGSLTPRVRAVLVVLCFVASGCGTLGGAEPERSVATPTTVDAGLVVTTTTTAPPPPTTATSEVTAPAAPEVTWIAVAKDHVTHLAPMVEPDGEPFVMPWLQPNPHQFGTPLTLMVTEGGPGDAWVRVQLPIKPNEQQAWVSTADYDISAITTRAEVDLSTQKVTVWDDGEVVAETDAVVGTERTPTPFGTFYVVSAVDDYHGEPALLLSSFSEVFERFDGGLPAIAIHRTFREGQESDPAVGSNGCIRIPPETIRFLAEHLPLGTPVDVVA